MPEPLTPGDIIYESNIYVHEPAYLEDYQRVQGITVLPVAAYLEMVLAAACDALGPGSYTLADVDFRQLLFLPEGAGRTVRTILSPEHSGETSFQVLSLPVEAQADEQAQWTIYASGKILRRRTDQPRSTSPIIVEAKSGLPNHGPLFSLFYFGSSEAAFTEDRYQLLIDGAKFADRHGYHAIWTPERHFHPFGGSYPTPAVLSAALATITERVHLRAGSVVLPLHHPVRVAEEWSVIDNLSQGRVGVSCATGWSADDFILSPENYDNRKAVMFSKLHMLRRFWRGEPLFLPGGSGKTTAVKLFPLPKQPELPVWITVVKNPEMYVKAGEIGANVLTNLLSQTPEELAQNIKLYRDSLVQHGYPPEAGQVTLLVHTFIGDDLQRVRQKVRAPFCNYLKSTVGVIQNLVKTLDLKLDLESLTEKDMDDLLAFAFERYFQTSSLIGTPSTALETITRFKDMGVNEIACFIDFGVDHDSVIESLNCLNSVRESIAGQVKHVSSSLRRDVSLAEIQERCQETLSGAELYRMLRESDIEYGPRFQCVQNIWKGESEAIGRLRMPQTLEGEAEAYQIHPALLDAGLQVLTALLPVNEDGEIPVRSYLPLGLTRMRVYAKPGSKTWVHAHLHPTPPPEVETLHGTVRLLDEDGRITAEIQGLRLHHLARPTLSPPPLDDLFYELQWRPLERLTQEQTERFPARQRGSWLLFSDSGGVGQRLSELLRARGEEVVQVSPGEREKALTQNHSRVDPSRPEEFKRLVARTFTSERPPLRGVVHLWSLNAEAPQETTHATLETQLAHGCETVMHLIQGLAEIRRDSPPQLWLVTRGSQHVGDQPTPISIAQSTLWGLGRVINLEHPELHCVTIDLELGGGPREAEAIFEELWFMDTEDQVAMRSQARFVPRLARRSPDTLPVKQPRPSSPATIPCALRSPALKGPSVSANPGDGGRGMANTSNVSPSEIIVIQDRGGQGPSSPGLPSQTFRPDSSYLITGGFGVLGIIIARHMVRQGARHLALMGRNGPTNEARAVLQELRLSGAEICEMKADVSQPEDVARALAQVADSMPSLRGIIHAAMWIEDGVLLQMDHERFEAAIKPKVYGAWNLHTQSLNIPLDFFVLFSSAASLLGSAGQGNYVAANAFLDALSHYRRFLGLPSLTIDWGQWAEVHLQTRRGLQERMALIGMRPLAPDQGLGALEWLLQRECAQMMVMSVNWSQVLNSLPIDSQPALLSLIVSKQANGPVSPTPSNAFGADRPEFYALLPAERRRWLESHILLLIANVLRLEPSRIVSQETLSNLGLDSLMAIEVKNSIESSLGVSLPLVRFLEGPTVAQLAVQVLEELAPSAISPDGEKITEVLEQVAQLSEEEARAMLADEKLLTQRER